jgi:spore germination cell wall hydrolase CwlJ-like protein
MKIILSFLLWLSTSAFTNIEPQVQPVDTKRITSEYNCIVQMLYHEARGMKNKDIDDVLSVAYNRTNSSMYPSSYCKVIYQKNQYSFTRRPIQKPLGTLIRDLKQHGNTYVLEAAFKAATGSFKPTLQQDVLWYHTAGYSVGWNMKKIEKVKMQVKSQHIFYKLRYTSV